MQLWLEWLQFRLRGVQNHIKADAYAEPSQIRRSLLQKWLTSFIYWLFLQNAPSYMLIVFWIRLCKVFKSLTSESWTEKKKIQSFS